jgi:hypothetical protein
VRPFAFCLLVAAAAPPGFDVTRTFDTVRVADGVYAFVAPEGRSGIVNSNSMAVIGDDGVLVVDATAFQTSARLEIAAIRKLTPLRDGQALTPAEIAEYTAAAEDIEAATEDWKHAEHVEPTLVFDDAITIRLGRREVRFSTSAAGTRRGIR